MTELSDTPSQGGQGNRTLIIAGVVVGLLLCCCCLVVALGALWACGDILTGVSNTCAFP